MRQSFSLKLSIDRFTHWLKRTSQLHACTFWYVFYAHSIIMNKPCTYAWIAWEKHRDWWLSNERIEFHKSMLCVICSDQQSHWQFSTHFASCIAPIDAIMLVIWRPLTLFSFLIELVFFHIKRMIVTACFFFSLRIFFCISLDIKAHFQCHLSMPS